MYLLLGLMVILNAGVGQARFERVDRVLSEIRTGHDTLRVVAGVIRDHEARSWPDTSVESVRIVNGRGSCLYADTFYVRKGPDGPLYAQVVVEAKALRSARGRGFMLRDGSVHKRGSDAPDYESPADSQEVVEHCRFIGVHGDSVSPATPWCNLCGEVRRGDRVERIVSVDWFDIRVPLRIAYERRDGGVEVLVQRDVHLAGLASFEVHQLKQGYSWAHPGTGLEPPTFPQRVYLLKRPKGDDGDSLTITPSVAVRVLRAFAECPRFAPFDDQGMELWPDPALVEVTIDGRHGYIRAESFRAIGLERDSEYDQFPRYSPAVRS